MRGPDPDRRTTPVIARYDAGSPEYTTACAPTAPHSFEVITAILRFRWAEPVDTLPFMSVGAA